METITIVVIILVLAVAIGWWISSGKKNESKPSEEEVEDKVISMDRGGIIIRERDYDEDDEEDDDMWDHGKTILCTRCGEVNATDNFNDKAVCDDCYDSLCEDDEEDDEEIEDDRDDYSYSSSGGGLFSFVLGLVVLGITLAVGAMILSTVGESLQESSNVTPSAMNAIGEMSSSFTAFSGIMPLFMVMAIMIPVLIIFVRMFSGFSDGGI